MFRLHVLGPAFLSGPDGGSVIQLGSQPKLLGLVTYLALADRDRAPRRDTLLALFWPELNERGARHALSQALSMIRHELGPAVMDGKWRDPVRLLDGALWCDASAFRAAAREGCDEQALELYTGAFLEGLHLAGAPEFEHWLSDERLELARLAGRSAGRLLATAIDERRWVDACRWARRAIRLDPYDEVAWRHLLLALDANGERAAALAEFERLSERLRVDLETRPSPETLRLVEYIRARASAGEVAGDVSAADSTAVPSAPVRPTAPAGEPGHLGGNVVGSRGPRRTLLQLGFAASVGGVAITVVAVATGGRESSPLDPAVIAVLPFQSIGPDPSAASLASAVPALLARRLDAEIGPHAVDPGLVLQSVARRGGSVERIGAREASAIAREQRAGAVVLGTVGESRSDVVMTGRMLDAATGEVRAQAAVAGAAGQLGRLADELLTQLLARAATEPEQRLPHLVRAPLPAVQWYLEGQRRLRQARAAEAVEAFARALDHDSTFATAALAATVAAGADGGAWLRRGVELAWRWRQRLSRADAAVVQAKLGPRYPAPSSLAEQLVTWEALAGGATRHPYEYEILYGYGDFLFHYGPLLGITGAAERARKMFERAAAADTTMPGAVQHLADLAFIEHDTARLRLAVMRVLARQASEAARGVGQWQLAAGVGDTIARQALAARLTGFPLFTLSQQSGIALADADFVARRWRAQAATLREAVDVLWLLAGLALNRGRPRGAGAFLDSAIALARSAPHMVSAAEAGERSALLHSLYWGGDTAVASAHLPRIEARVARGMPADSAGRYSWLHDLCVLEQWRLWHGAAPTARAAIATLAAAGSAGDSPGHADARVCAAMLRALAPSVPGAAPVLHELEALEELALRGEPGWERVPYGNLLIARLHERDGRLAEALAAVRRRAVYSRSFNQYLSVYAREEGRLALALGDTVGASRAWRLYLGLLDSPEAGPRTHRDSIRAQVAVLATGFRRSP